MTKEIENHLTANVHMKKKDIFFANLLGGLAWGVGSVIGATVVVGLLAFALYFVNLVPIVGDFVNQIRVYTDTSDLPKTR